MPAALSAAVRPVLNEYVLEGGTLFSDPYMCAFNADLSLACEVPGSGFAQVFGCRESDITTVSKQAVELCAGDRTYVVRGGHFKAFWDVAADAQIIATYSDGRPAVVANRFGRGQAIMSGVNFGLASSTRAGLGDDVVREQAEAGEMRGHEILIDAARTAGVGPGVHAPKDVRASVLHVRDGSYILIALNIADTACSGDVELPGMACHHATDFMSGEECPVTGNGVSLTFRPHESCVVKID